MVLITEVDIFSASCVTLPNIEAILDIFLELESFIHMLRKNLFLIRTFVPNIYSSLTCNH